MQNNKITISKETPPSGVLHQILLTKGNPSRKKKRLLSQKISLQRYFASIAPQTNVMISYECVENRILYFYLILVENWVNAQVFARPSLELMLRYVRPEKKYSYSNIPFSYRIFSMQARVWVIKLRLKAIISRGHQAVDV